jgi:hypothetical protein
VGSGEWGVALPVALGELGAAGCWLLAAGSWQQLLAASSALDLELRVLRGAAGWEWESLAAGCWLLAAGCWL